MKLKGFVSVLLSITLVFSLFTTCVSALSAPLSQSRIFVQDRNLYTSDGELLGTEHEILTVNSRQVSNGVEASVTENNDYQLQPKFASIPEYQETFSDVSKTKTFFITNDNKVYVNGKLFAGISDVFRLSSSGRVKRDSGGIPRFCHYYDDGRYRDYTFNSYSDIVVGLFDAPRPSGARISKIINHTNSFFNRAKSAVDSFQSNIYAANTAELTLGATLLAAGITAPTVVGLLTFGRSVTAETFILLNYYDNAKSDIRRAYRYIRAA